MSTGKEYCAIIFIGGGSSWQYGSTPEEAAKGAAKRCKSDWKSLFKFEKNHSFTACVIDMKDHDGWYADHSGIYDAKTNELIPAEHIEWTKVTA